MPSGTRTSGTRQPLVLALLLLILYFPVRRYAFPGNLPLEPEPYRLALGLLLLAVLVTWLAGARAPFRRTGFDLPMYLLLGVLLLSFLFNLDRAVAYGQEALGAAVAFWGGVLIFYVFVAFARTYSDVTRVLTIIVVSSAILGVFAVIEARNGWDPFSEFTRVLPGIELKQYRVDSRGGSIRAQTSAQHPIALGALFAMAIPVSLVYAVHRSRRWLLATAPLIVGLVAANSRTSVIMLAVSLAVLAALRWREVVRPLVPWTIVALAVIHFAMPGALGSLKNSFFPRGGLIAEQRESAGSRGSGRVADVGPALAKFGEKPAFGYGMGTAVSEEGPHNNSPIFDDQWLASLLDSGLVGVSVLLWIFLRFIRRMIRAATNVGGEAGAIISALAAGVTAYVVGMFFFDAFAFVQVTSVMFIYLALGAALVICPEPILSTEKVRKRSRVDVSRIRTA